MEKLSELFFHWLALHGTARPRVSQQAARRPRVSRRHMRNDKCFGSVGVKLHIANQNPKNKVFAKTKVQKIDIRRGRCYDPFCAWRGLGFGSKQQGENVLGWDKCQYQSASLIHTSTWGQRVIRRIKKCGLYILGFSSPLLWKNLEKSLAFTDLHSCTTRPSSTLGFGNKGMKS